MIIEELLNKYFEGETNREEEQELRRFFTQKNIPQELSVYRPIFAYLEKENHKHQAVQQKNAHKRSRIRYMRYVLGGAAATLLLLLAVTGTTHHLTPQPENQVWIDGVCYTDPATIQQQAQAAFSDVSFSLEDIFDALFED